MLLYPECVQSLKNKIIREMFDIDLLIILQLVVHNLIVFLPEEANIPLLWL